jgi:hypothetical protein
LNSASLIRQTILVSNAQFNKAVEIVNNPPSFKAGHISPDQVRELEGKALAGPQTNPYAQFYSKYKQATEGDKHTPQPGKLRYNLFHVKR